MAVRSSIVKALSVVLLLGAACRTVREVRPPPRGEASSDGETKLHLRDGDLLVASHWSSDGDTFTVTGTRFDAERRQTGEGIFTVRRDDIVLVERSVVTDTIASGGSVAALSFATAASVAGSVACAVNPKACFGSCPTFYVTDGGREALQAEGFSTSVARAFEADDLDDLPLARPVDGAVTLAMRNEALETHVTRRVSLLAVDSPAGSRAYREFEREAIHAVGDEVAAVDCDAPAVCPLLSDRDGREWNPGSDGVDLATRTSVVLRFPALHAREGALVLGARNSLMSTYLFYQAIAWLGRSYGALLASAERGDPALGRSIAAFAQLLGGVDVSVRRADGTWALAGTLPYIGPNAAATRAVPITPPSPDAPFEVRVEFARAHWRIDSLRAAPIVARDLPVTEVAAEVVARAGRDARADARSLRGEGDRLVTMPGDELTLRFAVPPARGNAAYLLRTRGYYYEWMRAPWLREENPPRAHRLLADPASALRELAAPYHSQEAEMDAIFNASRFARPGSP